jgi:hypothetical protein
VVDRLSIDPLLPSSCPIDISPSMHREIMNDLPMRLVKPKSSTDARRQLVKYAEAARRMIESRGTSLDSRKVVKWHAEDALEWLRKQRNASYEDLLVCDLSKPVFFLDGKFYFILLAALSMSKRTFSRAAR